MEKVSSLYKFRQGRADGAQLNFSCFICHAVSFYFYFFAIY